MEEPMRSYFKKNNSVCNRLIADMETVKNAHGATWPLFSDRDREEVTNLRFCAPSIQEQYENVDTLTFTNTVPEWYPRLKVKGGRKCVQYVDHDTHEDGTKSQTNYSWIDEFSSPFAWACKDQQSASLLKEDEKLQPCFDKDADCENEDGPMIVSLDEERAKVINDCKKRQATRKNSIISEEESQEEDVEPTQEEKDKKEELDASMAKQRIYVAELTEVLKTPRMKKKLQSTSDPTEIDIDPPPPAESVFVFDDIPTTTQLNTVVEKSTTERETTMVDTVEKKSQDSINDVRTKLPTNKYEPVPVDNTQTETDNTTDNTETDEVPQDNFAFLMEW